MSWGEEQQKEIETIRERKITVKLSDADCDRLARKCGKHGLTIGELIENFVGDLVGGTYSNGSDERDYADQWFERCWFGMFPETRFCTASATDCRFLVFEASVLNLSVSDTPSFPDNPDRAILFFCPENISQGSLVSLYTIHWQVFLPHFFHLMPL